MDQILLQLTYPNRDGKSGTTLFMFQLSPSPHLVTRKITYYQPKMKHRSSQRQDGVWQFLVSHPILTLEKVLSPQGSTLVPKFQHFSILTHFYTLPVRSNKKCRGVSILLHRSWKSDWGWKHSSVPKFLVPGLVWSICLLRLEIKLCSFQIVLKHIQHISDTFKCKSLPILYRNV